MRALPLLRAKTHFLVVNPAAQRVDDHLKQRVGNDLVTPGWNVSDPRVDGACAPLRLGYCSLST